MANIKAPEGYMTVIEYATLYKVTYHTVQYWLNLGRLPFITIGGKRFIQRSAPELKPAKLPMTKCKYCGAKRKSR